MGIFIFFILILILCRPIAPRRGISTSRPHPKRTYHLISGCVTIMCLAQPSVTTKRNHPGPRVLCFEDDEDENITPNT